MNISLFKKRLSFEYFKKYFTRKNIFATILTALLAVGIFSILFLISPPKDFPVGERVEIEEGTSLIESARILHRAGVVRSPFVLQVFLLSRFDADEIRAGTYQFPESLNTFEVGRAITSGTHGVPLIRLTIHEGLDNEQIDLLVSKQLPKVSLGDFITASKEKEGYLFPDTYYVPEEFTADDLVTLMENTFTENIEDLEKDLKRSDKTLAEVVTMASILEREGNSAKNMQMIAGILWKRIENNMPLQVDASFAYLLGKTSSEITKDDLKIDSPYNTYRYKGLPVAPLGNPGITALTAALNPKKSSFLFYLTAPNGTFYYANTYEEHLDNINDFLR